MGKELMSGFGGTSADDRFSQRQTGCKRRRVSSEFRPNAETLRFRRKLRTKHPELFDSDCKLTKLFQFSRQSKLQVTYDNNIGLTLELELGQVLNRAEREIIY